MNFTKKTLFWVIVLISLAGSFYFFDQGEERKKQLAEESLKLLPYTVDSVSEFWINNMNDNIQIKVMRSTSGWQLVQPLFANGDKKAIEDFLKIIVTARKDAVLFSEAEPEKLAEMGLDHPKVEMGLKGSGQETVIVFGGKGPTLNVSYAMFKGAPEVYRVHSDLKAEASKGVYAFRDKTILDFDPMKMSRLEIVQPGAPETVVENDNGKWNMLKPAQGRASMEKVLESLFAIKNGKVKAFVEEQPSDLSPYGLASPQMELTIHQAEAQLPLKLMIGAKDRARRGYFARSNQGEKVFTVEEDLVKTILVNKDKMLEK